MIDLSNLSLEELADLENKISDEKVFRQARRKQEAWKKVLEAVEEYEKVACGYGITGQTRDADYYSIEFSPLPGECDLYHCA